MAPCLLLIIREKSKMREILMKTRPQDLDSILEKYARQPQHLIGLLQDVQAAFNYISPEHLARICDHVGVPVTQAWSVATFYKSFSLEPRGEHSIKVCLGTTCHLRGGGRVAESMSHRLGVEVGYTTKDMQFSLETVGCLGSCAQAPVVMVDDRYFGRTTVDKVPKILKLYK